jgi:hypothetical protein
VRPRRQSAYYCNCGCSDKGHRVDTSLEYWRMTGLFLELETKKAFVTDFRHSFRSLGRCLGLQVVLRVRCVPFPFLGRFSILMFTYYCLSIVNTNTIITSLSFNKE